MAKFYRDTGGAYGLRHGPSVDVPIPAGAEIVEFDESTNQGLIDSLCGKNGFRWQDHAISGGQILRNGTPVALNADAPDTTDRKDFDAQVAAAITRLGAIKTAADAGLTNVQRDNAIGDLAVILRRVLRIVTQLRQLQR